MNRFKAFCVGASFVALLGLSGCKKQPSVYAAETARETETQTTSIVAKTSAIYRKEFLDGYRLIREEQYRTFEHNNIRNEERLYDKDDEVLYVDKGCDGTVDSVTSLCSYRKGEAGTEELFKKADEDYARKKKEMGLNVLLE